MEITNEIKAKVFGQYLGQQCTHRVKTVVGNCDWEERGIFILDSSIISLYEDEDEKDYDTKLILKSLIAPDSNIPNEECFALIKATESVTQEVILKYKGIFGDDGNTDFITKMFHSNCVTYQYLISKGYDLPNYLLGGKTLHECGLCIYEEKK